MAIKYDNCKDCHSRCIHAGKDREFICINGVSCKITKEKPKTKADRIRAMSDEELAENMVKFYYNEFRSTFCQHKPECNGGVITDEMCQQCIIKLLKQPAEVKKDV